MCPEHAAFSENLLRSREGRAYNTTTIAGLAYRLGTSFPSWLDGFDSRIPLSTASMIEAVSVSTPPAIPTLHDDPDAVDRVLATPYHDEGFVGPLAKR